MTESRCGTNAGVAAHRRRNETPCTPCKEAASEYQRQWRAQNGRSKAFVPYTVLGALLLAAPDGVREWAASELGHMVVRNAHKRARGFAPKDLLPSMEDPGVPQPLSTVCPRCEGCGKIADSDNGEPWTYWMNLPLKSAAAVVTGMIKPIICPACQGSRVRKGGSDAVT